MQGFLSYAHDDHECFVGFSTHLKALKRVFDIGIWQDHAIHGGAVWEDAIGKAIAAAEVFILLISPSFIASDYVVNTEIPAIGARRRAGNAAKCRSQVSAMRQSCCVDDGSRRRQLVAGALRRRDKAMAVTRSATTHVPVKAIT